MVPTTDREAIPELLSLTQYVDLCMPRGGEGLIRAVAECSKVPVIKHYKGVCHVYVDAEADLTMAEDIAFNAKVQRPGVCNAMETLLVDRPIAPEFLPRIAGGWAGSTSNCGWMPRREAILKSKGGPVGSKPEVRRRPSRISTPSITTTSSTCAWWTASKGPLITSTTTAPHTRTAS